VSSRGLSGVK